MQTIAHFTLQRFPSGWNAEWYDWNTNTESGWQKQPDIPGADAERVIATSPTVAFVLPSREAVGNPNNIPEDVAASLAIVHRFASRVRIWEIGNEWWLQTGAQRHPDIRSGHLQAYAELVRALVPRILEAEPQAQIYVTGDWLHPEDFAMIRQMVGESEWSRITGISVHPYCKPDDAETLCTRLPSLLGAAKSASGKTHIFASEWNARSYPGNNFGMPHASEVGIALGTMAQAGVDLAAYWPPVKILPTMAFVSADYRTPQATGLLFGWLAQYYRGLALETSGGSTALAAVSETGLNVFVFSRDQARHDVTLKLPPDYSAGHATAQVMYANSPDGQGPPPVIAQLPMTVAASEGGTAAQFVLNPGTPGRGSGWEIAHVSVSRSP